VRTTVDLPDDVLERVRSVAADRRTSVSKVIAESVSRAVNPLPVSPGDRVAVDPRTGLKVLDLGRLITMDEVRRATDDE
jgi:predicted transcriptional regulator